jgi:DNA-binding protein HU-beta
MQKARGQRAFCWAGFRRTSFSGRVAKKNAAVINQTVNAAKFRSILGAPSQALCFYFPLSKIRQEENCMNKSELLAAIAEKTNQSKAATGEFLDATIAVIEAAVASGDPVALVGFGTFKAAPRAAREGKNPKTGEKISIAATTVPRFTAGAGFKAKVAGVKAKKAVKK